MSKKKNNDIAQSDDQVVPVPQEETEDENSIASQDTQKDDPDKVDNSADMQSTSDDVSNDSADNNDKSNEDESQKGDQVVQSDIATEELIEDKYIVTEKASKAFKNKYGVGKQISLSQTVLSKPAFDLFVKVGFFEKI